VTSFHTGGPIINEDHKTETSTPVTLTGYGYHAGPGYDLATGLGTPNGLLLTRAMSAIAHHQMFYAALPDLLDQDGHGGWTSGADQTLLFQSMSAGATQVGIATGSDAFAFFNGPGGAYAWTNQLAQQSLQPDFDPKLVTLFDKQAQGALKQSAVEAGESVSIS